MVRHLRRVSRFGLCRSLTSAGRHPDNAMCAVQSGSHDKKLRALLACLSNRASA